ncbi:phosphotransferase [Salinispora tropica]|uniref:phosphotransferase n=1 Tax=Salinispora tropica TaxID=168695 RepID=UPI0003811BF6|nr:phosphotransferase [Salinispora tropica]
MVSATGARIGWVDLPSAVRGAVERGVGSPVVAAVSQPGGFSPGTADRVVTTDGRRAFVKAVGCGLNETAVALHRVEARVAAAIPCEVPAPRLLACHDDGEWIALVFEDVEGRHPSTPWSPGEVSTVFATLADLARVTSPCHLPVPTALQQCGPDLAGWRQLATNRPPMLDSWVAARLPMLQAAADRALAGLEGQTLVHADLRADNLLLRADGTVAIVDWPHACRGPAWLDRLLLCVNLLLHGGVDVDQLVKHLARDTATPEDLLIDVLTGYAGYFLDAARQPSPPGLPTLRAFQRAQADALLPWVRRQLTVREGAGRRR